MDIISDKIISKRNKNQGVIFFLLASKKCRIRQAVLYKVNVLIFGGVVNKRAARLRGSSQLPDTRIPTKHAL